MRLETTNCKRKNRPAMISSFKRDYTNLVPPYWIGSNAGEKKPGYSGYSRRRTRPIMGLNPFLFLAYTYLWQGNPYCNTVRKNNFDLSDIIPVP